MKAIITILTITLTHLNLLDITVATSILFPNSSAVNEIVMRDVSANKNAWQKQHAPIEQQVIMAPQRAQRLNTPRTAVISSSPKTKDCNNINNQSDTTEPPPNSPEKVSIDNEFLRQIIKTYLNNTEKALSGAEIRITYINTPETFTLPGEHLSWEVIPTEPGEINDSNFTIIFKVKDQQVKTCSIKTELQILATVVSAAVTLEKGQAIKAGDIRLTRRALTKDCNPFTETATLIGMLPNKTILQGQIIEDRDVIPPPVIKKGELVKILAAKGNLRLFVTGVAVTDGLIGEVIEVENIDSKKLIPCRVASPGIVIVEF